MGGCAPIGLAGAFPLTAPSNEDGRILEMSMNRPLEPGTYYVGISSVSAAYPCPTPSSAAALAMASYYQCKTSLSREEASTSPICRFAKRLTSACKFQATLLAGRSAQLPPPAKRRMLALKDVLPNIAATVDFQLHQQHVAWTQNAKDQRRIFRPPARAGLNQSRCWHLLSHGSR